MTAAAPTPDAPPALDGPAPVRQPGPRAGSAGAHAPTPAISTTRRYVNLTRELAVTQFKLKYTGSVLGYLWSLFNPLAQFGILYAVFVYLLHAGSSSTNFTMQLLLAIVIFNFFSECTGAAINAIAGNGNIVRKAYFPRAILVISTSLTATLTLLINLTLALLFGLALHQTDIHLSSLLVTPLLIIELYVVCLGIGLGLSALFVFYRDLGHVWGILNQVIFYGSAVVFPFSAIPGHFAPKLIASNPVAQVIEDLRRALISHNPSVPWAESVLGTAAVIPYVIVVVLLIGGALIFRHLTPRFAEYL